MPSPTIRARGEAGLSLNAVFPEAEKQQSATTVALSLTLIRIRTILPQLSIREAEGINLPPQEGFHEHPWRLGLKPF